MNKKQVIGLCITLAVLVLAMLFPPQQAVRKSDEMIIKPLYVYSIFRTGEVSDCCRFDFSYCEEAGYYVLYQAPAMCYIGVNLALFMGEVLLIVFCGGLVIYLLGNKDI